jgi:hypothetical protein
LTKYYAVVIDAGVHADINLKHGSDAQRSGQKGEYEWQKHFKQTKLKISRQKFPRESRDSSSKEPSLWIGE